MAHTFLNHHRTTEREGGGPLSLQSLPRGRPAVELNYLTQYIDILAGGGFPSSPIIIGRESSKSLTLFPTATVLSVFSLNTSWKEPLLPSPPRAHRYHDFGLALPFQELEVRPLQPRGQRGMAAERERESGGRKGSMNTSPPSVPRWRWCRRGGKEGRRKAFTYSTPLLPSLLSSPSLLWPLFLSRSLSTGPPLPRRGVAVAARHTRRAPSRLQWRTDCVLQDLPACLPVCLVGWRSRIRRRRRHRVALRWPAGVSVGERDEGPSVRRLPPSVDDNVSPLSLPDRTKRRK